MSKIKVSVIIPVYNVALYLRECLDSLVNQTLPELEFICINDGSTDNSLEILNEYAARDNRFVVVSQENQGPGIARNKGIGIAKGECIAFVDPDDYVDLNAFEFLYNKFKETGVDIVHFDYETFNQNSNTSNIEYFSDLALEKMEFKIIDGSIYKWKDIKKADLAYMTLCVWNRLYSAKLIKQNNIAFAPNRHGEDHIFAIKSTLFANKILYLKQPFYHYRFSKNSSAHRLTDNNFCIFDNIELLKQFLITNGLYEEMRAQYISYAYAALSWHYTGLPPESAKKYLKLCKQILGDTNFKRWKNQNIVHFSFIENIFSIKNKMIGGQRVKVLRLLGCSFVIRKEKKKVPV